MLAWSAGASAAGGSLDGREQYVLGRINAIRAEHGLPAKQASMTLNRAAEGFAQYLQDHGDPNDEGHFADGRTPSLRALAAGWPGVGPGEILDGGAAPGVIDSWMHSTAHRNAILNPSSNPVGVGGVGANWIVMFGDACPQVDGAPHPACELTGDYGDANQDIWRLEAEDAAARGDADWAWEAFCPDMWDPKPAPCSDPGGDDSSEPDVKRRNPRLKLSITPARRTLTVRVRTLRRARGKVKVTAVGQWDSHRARLVRSRPVRGGRVERVYRVRVTPGTWKVMAQFTGRSGWAHATRAADRTVR
ncbi:MAG TPA: CAP domain-containing protein [Solirubrobacteraceae bacterium]|nr:CAP domain-containing protein [Solirubrobacteraceae bacterium]